MGDPAMPRHVVLRSIINQAERATERKLVSSLSPCLLLQLPPPGFCLEFLPWLPLTMDHGLEV